MEPPKKKPPPTYTREQLERELAIVEERERRNAAADARRTERVEL